MLDLIQGRVSIFCPSSFIHLTKVEYLSQNKWCIGVKTATRIATQGNISLLLLLDKKKAKEICKNEIITMPKNPSINLPKKVDCPLYLAIFPSI